MTTALLLAVAAGFASALLAATITASSLGLLLVYLSPLPLLILGFAWHPLLAALGGLVAAILLSIVLTTTSVPLVYVALVGLPAWLFSHLATQVPGRDVVGRPAVPVGLILAGVALYSALVFLFGALATDGSYAGLEAKLIASAEQLIRLQTDTPEGQPIQLPGGQDPQLLIGLYVALVPPAAVLSFGTIFLLNLYVAAKVAQRSGRLIMPWADVPSLHVPRLVVIGMAVSTLLAPLPGYLGLAFELIAVAGLLVLALQGFAVLHFITRGASWRGMLLTATWVSTILFGLPALAMIALGLADLAFSIRQKAAAKTNPTLH
jgi:hypothetical protein